MKTKHLLMSFILLISMSSVLSAPGCAVAPANSSPAGTVEPSPQPSITTPVTQTPPVPPALSPTPAVSPVPTDIPPTSISPPPSPAVSSGGGTGGVIKLAKAPKVGEPVQVTFEFQTYYAKVLKARIEFERYDPKLYYPLGRRMVREDFLRLIEKNPGSNDPDVVYAVDALRDQPDSDVPASNLLVSGSMEWQPEPKAGMQQHSATISFPEEGEWLIKGRLQLENQPFRTYSDLTLTIGKESSTMGWQKDFSKESGGWTGSPPMFVTIKPSSPAPLVNQPYTVKVVTTTTEDLAEASVEGEIFRMQGVAEVRISLSSLVVSGNLTWLGPIKKGQAVMLEGTVIFPEEGDWGIRVRFRPSANSQRTIGQRIALHVGKEQSRFGWLVDHEAKFPVRPSPQSKPVTQTITGDEIQITGYIRIRDRDNQLVDAKRYFLILYYLDMDEISLGSTHTNDNSGYFDFGTVTNPHTDFYVRIYSDAYDYVHEEEIAVLQEGGTDFTDTYKHVWQIDSSEEPSIFVTRDLPSDYDNKPAFIIKDDFEVGWRFQELRYTLGSFFAEWDKDWTVFPSQYTVGGHIYLSKYGYYQTQDALHEMGHNIMYNLYQGYPPVQGGTHDPWAVLTEYDAWAEGWADFWAMATKNTSYMRGVDMEPPTWNYGQGYNEGDRVEERVAGALWDIYDSHDDTGTYQYDHSSEGFWPIWNTLVYDHGNTFHAYWDYLKNRVSNQLNANRAIFQNTIVYDYPLYLNTNVQGNGTITKQPDRTTYARENVTLTANPATGWYFDYWSGRFLLL
ncbi:MAG: hypothetical protein HYX79_06035 [Chloroflexi bacterium]|nr:hypothetical protein [Chloroflexota bacterium]